jgi:hypothetical protein
MALLVLRRVGLCVGQNQMCHLCCWLKLFLKNVRWEKIKIQKRWLLGRLSECSFVPSLYVYFCRSFLLCRFLGLQVTAHRGQFEIDFFSASVFCFPYIPKVLCQLNKNILKYTFTICMGRNKVLLLVEILFVDCKAVSCNSSPFISLSMSANTVVYNTCKICNSLMLSLCDEVPYNLQFCLY